MKYNLKHIADVITKITGVFLYEIESDTKDRVVVGARQAFLILCEKHGKYTRKTDITDFIDAVPSTLNSAVRSSHKQDVSEIIMRAERLILKDIKKNTLEMNIQINQLSTKDKILIVNNIISGIPKHKHAAIRI